MKLIILVLSKHDNNGVYDQFYNVQKETWDSVEVHNVKTYYYYGDSDNNHISNDKIYVNVVDILDNCSKKLIEALQIINDLDYDFIFRTNSSSYVDKQKLYDYLIGIKKNKTYLGVIGNHDGITFASGSGFIVSKDVVNLIIENKELIDYSYYDDVSIGKLLNSLDIHPQNLPRYNVTSPNINPNFFHYRIKNENRKDDIKYFKTIYNLKCNT